MGEARVKLAAAAAAVLVGGILVALAVAGRSEPSDFAAGGAAPQRGEITDLGPAARQAGCEARDFREEGDGTTADPVDYRSDPPHSGRHGPEPAQDGAYYDDPPPAEAIVHALRHGRIAIWFNPGLGGDEKADIKALFDEDSPHMILLPRESMPYEVAATAWTHRLVCERFDAKSFDALRAFRDRYRDRGPEFVP